jgi:hypothetical protein
MARKVVNRKALREEAEAAEKAEGTTKAPKKAAPKRKSRAKEPVEIRMKVFWGVYNQAMKLVAKYDFTQKKAAEQKAESLNAGGKTPHFVAKLKEAVDA